jgi:hypothetical protein
MSDIVLKKINNEEIKPMKLIGFDDNRPVKGGNIFPEAYANIYLCARKKSGKTVVIQKIIKECVGKDTIVIAFCSTVNKDKNWLAIRQWCQKHKINFQGLTGIVEDKVDFLKQLLTNLQIEAEEALVDDMDNSYEEHNKQKGKGPSKTLDLFGTGNSNDSNSEDDYSGSEYSDEDKEGNDLFEVKNEISMKNKQLFDKRHKTSIKLKDKHLCPEFILIFDDLSHELKFPSIVKLLKENRHYKLKTIISSQYLNDLKPESIKQEDYVLLFKGQDERKLEKIKNDCSLRIDFDKFKKIYDDATTEPFNFLYINTRDEQYRKNFDKMYVINQ